MSEKNNRLAAVLLILISGKLAPIVVYFAQLYHITSALQLRDYMATATAMSAVFAFVDTTLACTLVVLLRRRRSGFDRTDSMINRIMRYTIGTGLVTGLKLKQVMTVGGMLTSCAGVWALVGVVMTTALPNDFGYLLVFLTMPKRQYQILLTLDFCN